jgi:hypothetical protein
MTPAVLLSVSLFSHYERPVRAATVRERLAGMPVNGKLTETVVKP